MRLAETWEGHALCWQVVARASLEGARYVVSRMAAPGTSYRGYMRAKRTIVAGEAWLARPLNGERDAWARAWLDLNDLNLEYPPSVRASSFVPAPPGSDSLHDYPGRIRNCGYAVGSGDDDVLEAIRDSLIAWALGPATPAPRCQRCFSRWQNGHGPCPDHVPYNGACCARCGSRLPLDPTDKNGCDSCEPGP